jgi:hypothetical protein
MKELVTSHVEDQLRSIQTEADRGKWNPQELGTIEQTNKMATGYHGPANSPKTEYRLGT